MRTASAIVRSMWRDLALLLLLVLCLQGGVSGRLVLRPLPGAVVTTRRSSRGQLQDGTTVVAKTTKVKEKKARWHYFQCALAGAISCSTTHGLMVPLDVIKTGLQTESSMLGMNIYEACDSIFKRGGVKAFFSGFSAIYAGYFMQGLCKFGFYEYFKSGFIRTLDDRNQTLSTHPGLKLPVYIASSGMAEIIASFALTPLEVTKIDMISNPLSKGKNLFQAMALIVAAGGVKALYKGLPLVMLRQVPYTCVKLAGYDIIMESLRTRVSKQRLRAQNKLKAEKPKTHRPTKAEHEAAKSQEARCDLILQFSSGVLAGVLSAIISHPADVMLSKVCGGTAALTECVILQSPRDIWLLMRDLGVAGCFNGVKARAIMTAIITAAQFGIYERAKLKIMDVTYDSRLKIDLPKVENLLPWQQQPTNVAPVSSKGRAKARL